MLEGIQSRIVEASRQAGRTPNDVTLIAVSKMQPMARVIDVLDAGQRVFGENRVQEAAEKWPELRAKYPGCHVSLIGSLQTNKARQAMELFDAIQSVDRPKLAKSLARLAQELGHCPDLFIQVNTGDEPQKAGIAPAAAPRFIDDCRKLDLPILGLMCIPPANEPAAPHFAFSAKLAQENGLAALSMGMSDDFETAIALGATHVRVGSALFGARPVPK